MELLADAGGHLDRDGPQHREEDEVGALHYASGAADREVLHRVLAGADADLVPVAGQATRERLTHDAAAQDADAHAPTLRVRP